jgi:hypothetical protein
VSHSQLLTIKNFYALMVGFITPVQMEGLRLLLTPVPQEEFNQTSLYQRRDRHRARDASLCGGTSDKPGWRSA